MLDAISTGGKTDNKDKKIIDLAKKNRSLQLQVESLKTKAAKAAEFALKLKSERDANDEQEGASTSNKNSNTVANDSISTMSGADYDKKFKE